MKKILTVSLFAMMAVSAANADIASTKYVDDIAKTKQATLGFTPENVANRLVTIPVDLDGQAALTNENYPSANAVISYVDDALRIIDEGFGTQLDAKVDIDQKAANANKAVITNESGKITTGEITSGMIADKTIVNADISDSAAISASKISGLSEVATSGSYTDLSDKPTIGNATLTIQKNNTTVDTFTANAAADKTINITVPTKVSELTNDSSYATTTELNKKEASANKLKASDKTTVVSDTNKDTLFPTVGRVQSMINALNVTDTAVTGKYVSAVSEADGKITVTRTDLPAVNNATLTIQKNNTTVDTFTANAAADKTINITVPTKVSELTNDSSYATTSAMNTELGKKQNNLDQTQMAAVNSGVTADVVAKAKSAMQEANLKALESWTTGQCAEPTVTCSLISKGGKIAWEVVTY